MSAKSAGKTRLGNSGLVRQAAIPVRVGISNGRHRIRKLRLQSTFRHRPIRLPRRPTVGHFGLVTYHTVFYTGTNLSPSSTTTFDHDSRLLIPTQLILVSRAVAVRFAFPSFRTRTERERCTRVVLSSSEKFGIFFFFSIRFPGIFHPRYNFTYKSMRNLNFFESLTFLFLVDKKKNR